MPFGPSANAFGAMGTGGSVHGAWPDEKVGFAYVMNELRDSNSPDLRSRALLDALFHAIRKSRRSC